MANYEGTNNPDVLIGGDDNDYFNGHGGLDTLIGGKGNDRYYIDNYEEGGSVDEIIENPNEGTDTVFAKVNYVLGNNLENLYLEGDSAINGTGNELNNRIVGNKNDNIIDGGAGADTMIGGGGWDTYYVDDPGDVIVETDDPYSENDEVYSSISYTLPDNVQNLILTGTNAINGTGGSINNGIWGNSADNIIDGGAGVDMMVGGDGNDTYIVDDPLDAVAEHENEGIDTVKVNYDYTLWSINLENLVLTGTKAIYGTGNEIDNYITGNANNNVLTAYEGNDTLDGGTGADTLVGGKDNDTYIVDNTGDVITELSGEGTDIVNSSVTYKLGNNVENLTLTGTNAINATGNSSANIIKGNSASNIIIGNAGNDTLIGGNGDDIYSFVKGDGIDHITETGGADVIRYDSTVSFNDLYYLRNTNNLIIRNKTNTDQIIIDNYFSSSTNEIEKFLFSDNSYIDINPNNNTISKSIDENTNLTLDVLSEVGNQLIISNITNPIHGTVKQDSNKNIIYTPTTNYNGTDLFTYTLSDGNGGTVTKTVDITISNVNHDPTATLTSGTVDEDNSLILDVLASASDIDGDILSISGFTQGTHGSITKNAENKLVYKPVANYNGTDKFNYTISDGNGGTVTQTVTLTIKPVNDAPTATLTSGTVNEDNSLILDVLASASDVDGDTLSISGFTQGTHGSITKNAENKLVYKPVANYNGTDKFNYTISDGNGGTVTKTVNLTIKPVNDAPTATLTSGTVNEDNSLILDVLASASDVDGDTLSISGFTQGTHGSITKNAENKLVYKPAENYNGTDKFNYTISDGNGGTVTKTVNLTIKPVNDAPTATLESGSTTKNKSLILDVLASASDIDGDTLSISGFTQGTHGSITKNAENKLVYKPAASYVGSDSFNYTISDGNGGTVTKTVKMTITNSVNHNPTATLTSGKVNEDKSLILDVLASASDVDGDTLSISGFTQGTHGSITKNAENKLVYKPVANYNGTDKFNYTISDGNGGTVTKTVTLTIKPVNDAPTLNKNISNQVYEINKVLSFSIPDNTFTDIDGDKLSYTACLENGDQLPSWVKFDKNTRTFKVYGNNSTYQTLNIKVIASDGKLTASDIFTITPKKIDGNSSDNNLQGTSCCDLIFGYAGDDTLNGGHGEDVLIGGTDNDTYIVDNANDLVIENKNEGNDTVISSINYTLGDNVENLTLSGTYSISGTGNTLNNYITGNSKNNILLGLAGNDTLNGGLGKDTMKGGVGNDTYFVDTTSDIITEYTNEGIDSVYSSSSYTLSNNLENLTLTGTYTINGTGNALDNYITGNSKNNTLLGLTGNDTLDGGSGNDTMKGGTGNDTYFVNTASDIITEYTNEGTDSVYSSCSYKLGYNLENLTLTGKSAINATGNNLDNVITGNVANNILTGGTGNDTYIFSLGSKSDTILDTSGKSDKIHFNSDVSKSNIAVYMDSSKNLFIDYGTTKSTDVIKVNNQSSYTIEKVELNNGQYMTNAEINTLIQSMTAFAKSHNISMTSVADVRNNQNLMNLVSAAWHS